jgi:hypothetical protein
MEKRNNGVNGETKMGRHQRSGGMKIMVIIERKRNNEMNSEMK